MGGNGGETIPEPKAADYGNNELCAFRHIDYRAIIR
jgi:hypothetical protein